MKIMCPKDCKNYDNEHCLWIKDDFCGIHVSNCFKENSKEDNMENYHSAETITFVRIYCGNCDHEFDEFDSHWPGDIYECPKCKTKLPLDEF